MGNMVDSSGAFYSSDSGFSSAPDVKYYDKYTYDGSSGFTSHGRGKLGDATKETLSTFGDRYGGWYSDYANFVHSSQSWFVRSGGRISAAGVFRFDYQVGVSGNNLGTRAVLTP